MFTLFIEHQERFNNLSIKYLEYIKAVNDLASKRQDFFNASLDYFIHNEMKGTK